MRRLTLTQRLSVVFAVLLLACSAISIWLQIESGARHEQAVTQQLSIDLAAHIAGTAQLMDASGWRPDAIHDLFDKLMAVNPSVEVYLLDNDGRIVGDAAPPGRIQRARVDLAPIRKLLAGASLPVQGDDPRHASDRKVFSAAPVQLGGRPAGYVYVILQGEDRDTLANRHGTDSALRTTLWATALVALLGLVMGLVAFQLITRPLRELTRAVRDFDADGIQAAALPVETAPETQRNEIAILHSAFAHMGRRIGEQWQELARQDQQRRELVANISHDLRTPLTSLHGYLEMLRLKAETLSPAERQRYLDTALSQSSKVGRLAQELFELARLESGLIQPEMESFSLPDLVQDVLQKFELAAEARQQSLSAEIAPDLPAVRADLGMIERVLANLLDNAIRHNPTGTRIAIDARRRAGTVQVEVSDTGLGIPAALRAGLFTRASAFRRGADMVRESGGLGLVIVNRILQLHGNDIELVPVEGKGAVLRFMLAAG